MPIQLPIQNFEKQQSIYDDPAIYKIVSKGRRFGLTKGAANDFIKSAIAKLFNKGLWVDTVNTNIDRYVERYFIPALRLLPKTYWDWKKQAKILYIGESYIDFRSADRPENIEGFGYDKLFLNEAGIILKDEYLWHNAIRPMLWDYKAQSVIGGTPKGKGLFFELYLRGQDPSQQNYKSFHFTTFDNPYLDLSEFDEELNSMPDRVKQQEVYAEFLDDTGVVFRGVDAVATATPEEPAIGHVYVMGVDLAKVQDFTVISVYDRASNRQVYQKRLNMLDWPYQKKWISEISKHYNRALTILDATGVGDPIADDLLRAGVPVEPIKLTNESKKQIIEKLAIYIEQKKISIINIPETINELKSFTYDVSSTGKIRYNAPAGFHDDIVIANALAVWSLTPLTVKKPIEEMTPIQRALHGAKYGKNDDYIEV